MSAAMSIQTAEACIALSGGVANEDQQRLVADYFNDVLDDLRDTRNRVRVVEANAMELRELVSEMATEGEDHE